MARPNFLFIITDQQRADHVGCYGNNVLRTPNMDSLAARGVQFNEFHCANPSCMPNRCSMLTGRMPSAHGVWTNGVPLSMRSNTFIHQLNEAGYRTALVGKSHIQAFTGTPPVTVPAEAKPGQTPPPEHLRDAIIDFCGDGRYDQELFPEWENDDAFDVELPFYGFDHVDLLVQHGDVITGHYAKWAQQRCPEYKSLRGPENEKGGHGYSAPWAWRTSLPEEVSSTAYVEDRTLAYLDDVAAGGSDEPFFLQCSFPDPHHPFCPPGKYWDMYRPEDIELPASFAERDNPPPHLAYLWNERDSGARDRWTHLPMAVREQEAREAIALTYGMVTMIDDAIGRILAKLKEHGLERDTVIVFCSDHGDFLGDHQIMLKGPLHYRGLVRTPFIWCDPEGPSGARRGQLAGAIDIAPTILERAGLHPNYGMHGRSLLDMIENADAQGHDGILIEEDPQRTFMGFEQPARARSLITKKARVTIYETATWGELYDRENDPHEMRNLWDDPASAGLRSSMLERLARKMTETANRCPLPTNRG